MARKNKVLREKEINSMVNWAIVSHLKPHQLAYKINEKLGWDLQRLKNLESNAKSKQIGFALYTFQLNPLQPEFYLISLKDDMNILVKELKQFDYVLQIRLQDEEMQWPEYELLQEIKKIENILGVFEVDIYTIKNTNALFFDKQLDKLEVENEGVKRKRIGRIIK